MRLQPTHGQDILTLLTLTQQLYSHCSGAELGKFLRLDPASSPTGLWLSHAYTCSHMCGRTMPAHKLPGHPSRKPPCQDSCRSVGSDSGNSQVITATILPYKTSFSTTEPYVIGVQIANEVALVVNGSDFINLVRNMRVK